MKNKLFRGKLHYIHAITQPVLRRSVCEINLELHICLTIVQTADKTYRTRVLCFVFD